MEHCDNDCLEMLANAVDANAESNHQGNQTSEVLQNTMLQLADVVQNLLPRIDQMQEEIRGLQTENREILDTILGDQTQDD